MSSRRTMRLFSNYLLAPFAEASHASLMLKQGIHPKVVQERLGHASIQVTLDTYSHVTSGLQKAAAKGFDELVLLKQY